MVINRFAIIAIGVAVLLVGCGKQGSKYWNPADLNFTKGAAIVKESKSSIVYEIRKNSIDILKDAKNEIGKDSKWKLDSEMRTDDYVQARYRYVEPSGNIIHVLITPGKFSDEHTEEELKEYTTILISGLVKKQR